VADEAEWRTWRDEADDVSPPKRPTAEATMRLEADLADDADDVSLSMRR
jgi:hypothetical protein